MAFTKPERFFSKITFIDVKADIKMKQFSHVLLDIDNTILTRDTHEVPTDVRAWLNYVQQEGISICLLSNNWHKDVNELAEKLQLPLVCKAMKPLPFAFWRALKKIKAKKSETLVIGDQLITDVFGAHAVGLKAYLLRPLVEQDLWHTLLLRKLEWLFIKHLAPEGQK